MTSRWREKRSKRVQVGRAARWMAREETRVYRVYQRRPRGTSENWQYKPLEASPRSRIALGKCVWRNWRIGAGNGARTRTDPSNSRVNSRIAAQLSERLSEFAAARIRTTFA